MKMFFIACMSAPFLFLHGGAVACGMGDWIAVDVAELKKEEWRRHSETGFVRVDLDANGDGIGDQAVLVVSQDGTRSAIKVCFGPERDGASADCRILAEDENIYSVMGLERRDPGCHEFHEDDAGVISEGKVCSKADVLEYFRFGSSGSFFVYNKDADTFVRYWDSY